ncbi:CafA Ribonucleases G and E [Rhabdaerophilaceae bacterium]
MTTRMLIDSTHPEETRVVVQRGNRVEEFDFESANRRPLRGNIYLAKVTRVEPSLQAAFVDFGGNRHGFLAFAEIHPDYYQIPVADRQALLAEQAEAASQEDADDDERARPRSSGRRATPKTQSASAEDVIAADLGEGEAVAEAEPAQDDEPAGSDEDTGEDADGLSVPNQGEEIVEQLGGNGDALEEVPQRRQHRSRKVYKIQEVIRRRQILLVQVVKEERGNKGAALTTYLSLAGRYSVLMPNTARGGGISRKITNSADRKRLKTLASDLEVPDGMGVILRTAGASRTKTEIKRDFEYLMRLWESVRTLTLESTAPALVYEEGSLIKRAIRDLYSKDVEEILVGGDEGYREAKDFMRMLMPSHAKAVQPYRETTPLFSRFGVEAQLDSMFSNIVTLKSGGYIVINQTEALVSIDVNSGRSTKEHNIEDTALKTNLEAAEEVSRQLRLRDLAGLIVIDFIDMEENRNNRAVERKLNDCLKNDRARIQVGRISHFGLLEMSRQRIRTGVLESSSIPCPHCAGTGLIRSTPSLALSILRALEEQLVRNASHDCIVRTRVEIALYLLNQKRETIRALEARFGVTITVETGSDFPPGQHYVIERGETATRRIAAEVIEGGSSATTRPNAAGAVHPEDIEMDEVVEEEPEEEGTEELGEEDSEGQAADSEAREGNGDKRRRRRRRRRGRGGREDGREENRDGNAPVIAEPVTEGEDAESDEDAADNAATAGMSPEAAAEEKRRRRRRRGGRRNRRDRENRETLAPIMTDAEAPVEAEMELATDPVAVPVMASAVEPAADPAVADAPTEPVAEDKPVKPRRGRAKKAETETSVDEPASAEPVAIAAEPPAKAPRTSRSRKKVVATEGTPVEQASIAHAALDMPVAVEAQVVIEAPVSTEPPAAATASATEPLVAKVEPPAPVAIAPAPMPVVEEVVDPNRPKRSGWWAKAKQALGG